MGVLAIAHARCSTRPSIPPEDARRSSRRGRRRRGEACEVARRQVVVNRARRPLAIVEPDDPRGPAHRLLPPSRSTVRRRTGPPSGRPSTARAMSPATIAIATIAASHPRTRPAAASASVAAIASIRLAHRHRPSLCGQRRREADPAQGNLARRASPETAGPAHQGDPSAGTRDTSDGEHGSVPPGGRSGRHPPTSLTQSTSPPEPPLAVTTPTRSRVSPRGHRRSGSRRRAPALHDPVCWTRLADPEVVNAVEAGADSYTLKYDSPGRSQGAGRHPQGVARRTRHRQRR